MLDRLKLVIELHKVAGQLFTDPGPSYHLAQDIWRLICKDQTFLCKVRQVHNAPWPVPLWQNDLGAIIPIQKIEQQYVALSVDGSQIYPDRHNILSCCLINTGSVVVPYNIPGKRVQLFSEPTVFAGVDDYNQPFTTDSLNCKRQELELRAGLELAQQVKNEYGDVPAILFFDGSLIFWHLSSKEIGLRDQFLDA